MGMKAYWLWERYTAHLVPVYLVGLALGAEALVGRWPACIRRLPLALPLLVLPSLRSRPVPEASNWRAGVAALDRRAAGLRGVVTLGLQSHYGDESERPATLYWFYRARALRAYSLLDGRLRPVETVRSLLDVGPIPRIGAFTVPQLWPGLYGLLGRMPTSCEVLRPFAGGVEETERLWDSPDTRICRVR